LERGYAVLLQDKDSVSAAAFESGFSDIHAFSKAFKNIMGLRLLLYLNKVSRICQIEII
jgi:AraC-like DNA-binding protein